MGTVEDFVARYRKEYDFYYEAARLCAQMLEARLQEAGIRSIVTSRAKSPFRLELKVRARSKGKAYGSVAEIYDDIVDLAGARVALYFPGQIGQVDTIVKQLFVVIASKEFPDGSPSKYLKRFSGYSAAHYRVRLRESLLSEAQQRYAEARIEIQVASVLMHAWSEVEHDLVYKPLQGELSMDEYAVLEELNGLVLAGEIALERLQRAGEARVAAGERKFGSHYELAANLLGALRTVLRDPISEAGLGRVDVLFDFLKELSLHRPNALAPYLKAIHSDTEKRPIAEQVVDQLLSEDASRYAVYNEVLASRVQREGSAEASEALGIFMSAWIEFERVARSRAEDSVYERSRSVPTAAALEKSGLIDAQAREVIENIRRIRNAVVHGLESRDPAELRDAGDKLRAVTGLMSRAPIKVRV